MWLEGRCVFLEDTILYPSVRLDFSPQFGYSVAISSDGSRALVGATFDLSLDDPGAAYVFDMNPSDPTDWTEQTILYPSSSGAQNSDFGYSVAISSDGSRALVGAPSVASSTGEEAAYVFDMNPSDPTNWTEQTILYPSSSGNSDFGNSVAISSDGSRALVGAFRDETMSTAGTDAGAAYVFDVNPSDPTNWTEQAILYPNVGTGGNIFFGSSVAISSDGSRALVGATGDDTTPGYPEGSQQQVPGGATYVFDVNPSDPTDWTVQTILYPNAGSGTPPNGNDPGARPNFGNSVAISSDGSRALVGATGDDTVGRFGGATYVFDVNPSDPTDWTKQTILYPARNSSFGSSVAISSDGRRALVGASGDRTKGLSAGATYVFDVNPSDPTNWTEQTILYPSVVNNFFPRFGSAVAISSDGSRGLVGAFDDGTVDDYAGSTYVFASCSSGTIINADGTACESCPSGQVPNVIQTACEPCPSGQVPNVNQTACTEESSDGEGSATALFENNWMAWIFF